MIGAAVALLAVAVVIVLIVLNRRGRLGRRLRNQPPRAPQPWTWFAQACFWTLQGGFWLYLSLLSHRGWFSLLTVSYFLLAGFWFRKFRRDQARLREASADGEQPPWLMYPPPARRRHSRWLTIGLPVGAFLAVSALLGIAVNFLIPDSIDATQRSASSYAGALARGRFADAHAMLCRRDRNRVTVADVAARYRNPPVTGYAVTGGAFTDVQGHATAQATLVLYTADGRSTAINLPLADESGRWRPCP